MQFQVLIPVAISLQQQSNFVFVALYVSVGNVLALRTGLRLALFCGSSLKKITNVWYLEIY